MFTQWRNCLITCFKNICLWLKRAWVYRILGWQVVFFFSFSILNIASNYLLPCKVSAEKSVDHLTGYPFIAMICFCLAAFMILPLTSNSLIMCLSLGLSFMQVGGLLVFVHPQFSSNLRKFLPIISSNNLSASFSLYPLSGTSIMHMLVFLCCHISPLGSVYFFHSFCPFILNNF